MGTRVMAQSVDSFLDKHEDLNLDPQHLCQKHSIVVCTSNANTWEDPTEEDPWSSLTSQHNLTSKHQAQRERETLSWKTRQASIDGDTDVDLCFMSVCALADYLDAIWRKDEQ